MSERDDDFLDQGDEAFNPDADEFQIPEDPHGDDSGSDDFLMQSEDDFHLSEEDIADASGEDGTFFLEDDEDGRIDLDQMGSDAFSDETGHGEYADVLDESGVSGEHEPENTGLGWKAFAAIGFVAIVGAGGITYAFLPSSGGSSAPQQTERLPEPPPAPPEAPGNGSGGNGGMAPPQQMVGNDESRNNGQRSTSTNGISGPVSVDPFPSAESPSQPQEFSGYGGQDLAFSNVNEIPGNPGQQLEVTEETPEPVANVGQVDRVVEVTPFNLDQPNRGSSGSVTDPASRSISDAEPEYVRALREQRQAFSILMDATRRHGEDLADMKGSLQDYQDETKKQVTALDDRVGRLEEMMKKNESSRREQQTRSESVEKVAKRASGGIQAPKSPAEVERIQRILKEHNYRPGEVDGIMGGQTRWAIKRLQQEHGLSVTGWMDEKTRKAMEAPKRYSGTYPEDASSDKKRVATGNMSRQENAATAFGNQWFVRGVTPVRAIVYRPDGVSYAVRVGTEIPGMGQVTQLDPEKLHVVTANGVITRR